MPPCTDMLKPVNDTTKAACLAKRTTFTGCYAIRPIGLAKTGVPNTSSVRWSLYTAIWTFGLSCHDPCGPWWTRYRGL